MRHADFPSRLITEIMNRFAVLSGSEPYRAKALDIDDQGRLIILRVDGTQEALNSGEISIRLNPEPAVSNSSALL